jgi:CHAT domain-containing protein
MAGESLAQHGDVLLRDEVAVLVSAAGDSSRLLVLARGHALYGKARRLYAQGLAQEALVVARAAANAFLAAGSPFALRVRLLVASCIFYTNDPKATLDALSRLEADLAPKRSVYQALDGQTKWLRGLTYVVSSRAPEAIECYEYALRALERSGEIENVAAVHGLLAEAYEYLGDHDRAFRHRDAAAAVIALLGAPTRLHPVFSEAADAALRQYPEVALLYQNAILRLARQRKLPLYIADALLWRALIRDHLGENDGALNDAAEARAVAATIADEQSRTRTLADVDAAEGRLTSRRTPMKAIRRLTSALAFFSKEGNLFFHPPELLLLRGRAYLALGDTAAAERDFRRGAELLERQRSDVHDRSLRVTFFERADDLFDEAILLAMRRGDVVDAFALAERSRARTLLDAYTSVHSTAAGHPMTVDSIRRHLPEATAIVEYAVTADRLCVWVVRRDSLFAAALPITETSLGQIATAVQDTVRRRETALFCSQMRAASALLIDPIRPHLRGVDRVVIVAARRLNDMPFSALLDARSGRYLVEDFALVRAPSASIFIKASERASVHSVAEGSAAVIGAPSFAPKDHPALDTLPAARQEANAIAQLYRNVLVLAGSEATVARVQNALSECSMVHYAGHSLANDLHPDLAALVLAPDGKGAGGDLRARDIARLHMPRLRLLVLSACSTNRGRNWRIEGQSSLASAFLAGGVPTIVASMWPIDDEASASMMIRFHRAIARSSSLADALRQAQLSRISAKGSPLDWAAFQVIGGEDERREKEYGN